MKKRRHRRLGKRGRRARNHDARKSLRLERLEDRSLLAGNTLATFDAIVTGAGETTDLTLEVSDVENTVALSIHVEAADGSALDPASVVVRDSSDAVVSPLLSMDDQGAETDSLALVPLVNGEYTIEVTGEAATFGGFRVTVSMAGDVDCNGVVDSFEVLRANAAQIQGFGAWNLYTEEFFLANGIDLSVDQYSEAMDVDRNGVIDNIDFIHIFNNQNTTPISLELTGDTTPPEIAAALETDDGTSSDDGITSDPTVVGTVTDESEVTAFTVKLDSGSATNILPQLNPDGSFRLDTSFLDSLAGGTLSDGEHTLEFAAADAEENSADPAATLTFTFIRSNGSPSVAGTIDDVVVEEDAPDEVISLAGIFADTNLADGDILRLSVTNTGGSFVAATLNEMVLSGGSQLTLDFLKDQNGTGTVSVTATDAFGEFATTSFQVTATPVNDPPTALDDDFATDEATSFGGNVLDDNGNGADFDVDGDAISVLPTTVTTSRGNSVTIAANGDFTYDPSGLFESLNAGGNVNDTFTYTIEDPSSLQGTAMVSIQINGLNDTPTADDVGIAAVEDGPTVNGNFAGDDADDEDDQSTLTYTITSNLGVGEGSVTNNNDGTFTFDRGSDFQELNLGETRQVTFQYTATDARSAESTAGTVTITVTGVNDTPTAADVGIGSPEDGATVDGNFAGDDADNEDDQSTLTYAITSGLGEGEGSVVNNNDGTFTFDPDDDFQGLADGEQRQVSFEYTATDSRSTVSTVGTVTVTVTGGNDAPVAIDDDLGTNADTLLAGANVLDDNGNGADFDPDVGNTFLVFSHDPTSALGVSVSVASTGEVTYDASSLLAAQQLNQGQTLVDTFEYDIVDNLGVKSGKATATITITGVNDTPTAGAVGIGATEDGPTVNGNFAGDDVDNEDDVNSLTYAITSTPSEGSVQNNNDGTFTFDPGSDFQDLSQGETRQVAFQYTATDSRSAVSTPGTVTVTVTGVNDTPTASAVGIGATEDGPTVNGNFAGDDSDSEDDVNSLTYAITSTPSEGSVQNNNDGTFTFDPGSDFQDLSQGETRQVTFQYTATDTRTATSTAATVTVTVTGVNDTPTAGAVGIDAEEDGPTVNGNFAGDDSDSEDDVNSLTYAITSTPSEGSVQNNNDGTFTFDPGSDFQDLSQGETRQVAFQYTATDTRTATSTAATVTVTVTGVNDTPTAGAVGIDAEEDGPTVNGNFAGDDIDSEDDVNSLTYAITSTPSEGSVQNNNDGTFTFDPDSDFQDLALGETRDVTFQYTATDTRTATSTAGTVTVTVTGTNDNPTAFDDAFATSADTALAGANVLDDNSSGADSDPDTGDTVSVANHDVTSSQGVTVSVSVNGDVTYDPSSALALQQLNEGQQLVDTFEYDIEDNHGAASNSATASITVTGVNDAPTAGAVGIDAEEDGPTVNGNFAGDDVDNEDDVNSLTYAITSTPSEGSVQNNNDGTFTFDPGSDFQDLSQGETRQVAFQYTATDSRSAVSTPGTVTVTVTGVNDTPTASAVGIGATEDSPTVNGNFAGDDVDSEDDVNSLTYAITSTPSEGSVQNNNDGTFTFDPGSDFQDLSQGETRQVTFQYTATDARTATSTAATVTVTVTGVNDTPTASVVGIGATEDGPTVNGNFAGDDIDSEDDVNSLTYAITLTPSEGSVQNNNDGTFTFDPGSDFQDLGENETRDVTFKYTATDVRTATSTEATVTVTVTGNNDDPTANDDAFTVPSTSISSLDVLADNSSGVDFDIDQNDTPFVSSFGTPGEPSGFFSDLGATLTLDGSTGEILYDPSTSPQLQAIEEGESLVDIFDYMIADGNGGFATATVTLTVVPNVPPVAVDDEGFATTAGSPLVGANVLADNGNGADFDPDPGDTITVTSHDATSAAGVAVSISANGDVTYAPDSEAAIRQLSQGEELVDTFDYRIIDNNGGISDPATVSVTVTGVNDTPTAGAVGIGATEDGPTVNGNFAGDDVDNEDDVNSLTYAITSTPSEGSVQNNNDGTFTFDPGSDFQDLSQGETRQVAFQYTATDSRSAVSTPGTVTVTVTGVNDTPTASAVGIGATEDGPTVNGNFAGDDSDSEDDVNSLTYAITSTPSEGSVQNNNDGTFTFDPGSDFQDLSQGETRQVTFQYTATDTRTATSTAATVTVTVTGVNDTPTAGAVGIDAEEDGPTVNGNFAGDDSDSEDDVNSLTYAITSTPSEGSVQNNNDGTFTFDPGSDFQDLSQGETRQVAFQYTATDTRTATSTAATVTVTVTGVNDTPTAGAVGIDAEEDGPTVNGNFAGDDIDSEDDVNSLTYAITSTPSEGSVQNNNDGTFTFDPDSDFQDLALGETRDVTFQYTATDTRTATSTAGTVTVTVTGTNDNPTAGAVGIDATEDGSAVNGNFAGDDTDSDDDQSTLSYDITVDLDAGEGSVINNNDGTFTFDPGSDFQDLNQGETRQVTFQYAATDDHSAVSTSATVTVTVTGVNDDPTVSNLGIEATEDGSTVDGSFAGDDADDEDDVDSLTYQITSVLPEGSVQNNNDGTFTFDPGSDFQNLSQGETRLVAFQYIATDSRSATSNSGVVSITVTGVNDTPTAGDVGVNAVEDGPTVDDNFGGDDVDSEDDQSSLTYAITVDLGTGEGSVVNNNDGTFTFDPDSDFQDLAQGATRDVTFQYTATDTRTATSTAGTVTVTVTGVNDPPVAQNDDGFTTDEDTAVEGNVLDDNNNGEDSDPDGDALTVTAFDATSQHGATVTVDADGNFSYDPSRATALQDLDAGQSLTDTFSYTISDGNGGGSQATVSIDVDGVTETVEIVLVVRDAATTADQFDFFTATSTSGGTIGAGRFELLADNSLNYELLRLGSLDLGVLATPGDTSDDKTPGDTSDDVTSIVLRDALTAQIIDIDADADSYDILGGVVTGNLTSAEGFTPSVLAQLRAGELFVEVTTTSQTFKLGNRNITASAEVSTLPSSITNTQVGGSYVVEVWARDSEATSTGLSSVFVDINFDPTVAQATAVNNDGPFSLFTDGTIDNFTGKIDSLGGGTLAAQTGLNPAYARVGFVTFNAIATANLHDLLLDLDRVDRQADPNLPSADIRLIDASILQNNGPQFNVIQEVNPTANVTVLAGTSTHLALDGTDPDAGDTITYTAQVTGGNAAIVTPTVASGNRSLRITIAPSVEIAGGDMIFELFEQQVGDITSAIIAQANADGFDGKLFERIVPGFVIQSGSPTAPGLNASVVDDQFNTQTLHLGPGYLSLAKQADSGLSSGDFISADDTNSLAYFLTLNAARFLDGGHSVFAYQTEGQALRETIEGVTVVDELPVIPVVQQSVEIFVDPHNGVLTLTAPDGASGTAEVTITADDGNGGTTQRIVNVTVQPDTANMVPFLDPIAPVVTTQDTDAVFNVTATDAEGDDFVIDARRRATVNFDNAGSELDVTPTGTTNFSHKGSTWSGGVVLSARNNAGLLLETALGTFDTNVYLVDSGTAEVVFDTPVDSVNFFYVHGFGIPQGTATAFDASNNVLGSVSSSLETNFADAANFKTLDFATDITRITFTSGIVDAFDYTPYTFGVVATDFEGNAQVTVTPPTGFTGDLEILVRVSPTGVVLTNSLLDTQVVTVTVSPPVQGSELASGENVTTSIANANADDLQLVLNSALDAWQSAVDFDLQLDVQLTTQDFSGTVLGAAAVLDTNDNGDVTQALIALDDDAAGVGWHIGLGDPTPDAAYDLYSVLVHELGHALGIRADHAGFASNVVNAGGEMYFVADWGSAKLDDTGHHLDPALYPRDVMAPILEPGERRTVSQLDAQILTTILTTNARTVAAESFGLATLARYTGDVQPVRISQDPLTPADFERFAWRDWYHSHGHPSDAGHFDTDSPHAFLHGTVEAATSHTRDHNESNSDLADAAFENYDERSADDDRDEGDWDFASEAEHSDALESAFAGWGDSE